jgi:hypothetical protein
MLRAAFLERLQKLKTMQAPLAQTQRWKLSQVQQQLKRF